MIQALGIKLGDLGLFKNSNYFCSFFFNKQSLFFITVRFRYLVFTNNFVLMFLDWKFFINKSYVYSKQSCYSHVLLD